MAPDGLFVARKASKDEAAIARCNLSHPYHADRKGARYVRANGYTKSKQHIRCWEDDAHADFDIDQMG